MMPDTAQRDSRKDKPAAPLTEPRPQSDPSVNVGSDVRPESSPGDEIASLLARPPEQRIREYRYRFAQSIVFGVPVVFLEYFGRSLGGPEAERWVALMQALLAGWVMYVGAAGMLFEGLLTIRRRITADLLVSLAAAGAYLWSLIAAVGILTTGQIWHAPLLFHVAVLMVGGWAGIRWYQLYRISSP